MWYFSTLVDINTYGGWTETKNHTIVQNKMFSHCTKGTFNLKTKPTSEQEHETANAFYNGSPDTI